MQLEQAIKAHGFDSIEAGILAAAQPACMLYVGEAGTGAVGDSRVGGAPDLPTSLIWPRTETGEAFTFVAQVNPAQVRLAELPAAGLLYFFVGEEGATTDARVLLHQGTEALVPTTPPGPPWANETYGDIPGHRINPELFTDIPHWATSDYDDLVGDLDEEQVNAWEDLEWALFDTHRPRVGQLLGPVRSIGHDTSEDTTSCGA